MNSAFIVRLSVSLYLCLSVCNAFFSEFTYYFFVKLLLQKHQKKNKHKKAVKPFLKKNSCYGQNGGNG